MTAFMASGRAMASTRPSFVSPRSFFNWGKGAREAEPPPPQLQFRYHDVELPFPMSLVANTHLRDRELKCCYKATVDGFSATDFHRRSDFKGPCVVVGYTDGGFKFGGFSPEGYRSTDDYYDTLEAFLFYWPEETVPAGATEASPPPPPPVVLPKVGGSGAALFDYSRGGPQFGADGLLIGPPLTAVMGVFTGPDSSAGVGDLRSARSRLGLSYARRADGKESLFGDDGRAELAEDLQLELGVGVGVGGVGPAKEYDYEYEVRVTVAATGPSWPVPPAGCCFAHIRVGVILVFGLRCMHEQEIICMSR